MLSKLNGLLIKTYNKIISLKFINRNNKVSRRIRAMLYHNICFECKANFGNEHPDKCFFVIRSSQSELGFFGLYNYVIENMKYAVKKGWEPVVDWKFYPNDYIIDDQFVGKMNAWDFFFNPSSGILLDEVYKSKNVIMSSGKYFGGKIEDEKELQESNSMIKQYIVLNEEINSKIEREYHRLGMDLECVLGVKLRGTDFRETKPKYHTIAPTVQETIDIIHQKEIDWGQKYSKILVVTEDEIMYEQMKEIYGERVVSNDTIRYKTTHGKWLNEIFASSTNKLERMEEYLISVYLLAKCDAIIGPAVGATLAARKIKGEYERCYFSNLGSYK